MVQRARSLGLVVVCLLAGCSSNGAFVPGEGEGAGVDEEGIVGGATDSTHRSIFGILINNQGLCSGSLILPNLILTARHCVAPVSDESVNCATDAFGATYAPSAFVTTWDTNLTDGTPSDSLYGASKVFVPSESTFCGNDLALIMLDSNVPSASSPTIEPRVSSEPMTDEPFNAIGYGITSPNDTQGASAGIRRSIGNLAIGCVGAKECNGTRATDSEWAANSPICSGDSGGPALDANGRVIGVASRSDETCAIGLYSGVYAWRDLVLKAANEAVDEGGYEPPSWVVDEGSDGGAAGSGATGGTGGSGATTSTGGTSSAGKGGSATGGRASAGAGGTSGGTAGTSAGGRTGAAGRASAGTSGSTAGTGTVPPDAGTPDAPDFGEACTSACSGVNLCYSATRKPPGICVPPCTKEADCPDGYSCASDLHVCAPDDKTPDDKKRDAQSSGDDPKSDGGCGCRITPMSDTANVAWQALAVLTACGGLARRRRRSPHA